MSIMPNHPPPLPKWPGTVRLWVSLIAGAVVLWLLEPAGTGSLPHRLVVILIAALTVFVVWAVGWLVFCKIKWRGEGSGRSGPSYPMNRPIG